MNIERNSAKDNYTTYKNNVNADTLSDDDDDV
jgi:hypothetical protein